MAEVLEAPWGACERREEAMEEGESTMEGEEEAAIEEGEEATMLLGHYRPTPSSDAVNAQLVQTTNHGEFAGGREFGKTSVQACCCSWQHKVMD